MVFSHFEVDGRSGEVRWGWGRRETALTHTHTHTHIAHTHTHTAHTHTHIHTHTYTHTHTHTHTQAGTDRTGEVSGAYYIRYMNMSFDAALSLDNHVNTRDM